MKQQHKLGIGFYPWIRRVIEIILVLLALPLALVLGLLAAIIILFDSRGGVFFIQTRPGKNGLPFSMFKFRTMKVAREEPFRLTDAQDSRLTRTGGWLRALHLDEIPQLWHVLSGEMGLIGPRPVPLELYAEFLEKIPQYSDRHAMAPGITGLAQVCLGYVNTLEGEREKCQYDLYYIANQSPALDAWILWATIAKILSLRVDKERMKACIVQFNTKKVPPDCSGST